MEAKTHEIIDDILEISKSIKTIYEKIAEYELNEDIENLQEMRELLVFAIKMEQKNINKIKFEKSNHEVILRYVKRGINGDDLDKNYDVLEKIRLSNIFEQILLERYGNFLDLTPSFDIIKMTNQFEKEDQLIHSRYSMFYTNTVSNNNFALINRELRNLDDKELITYLTYLKYRLLFITPKCEHDYISFDQSNLLFMNLNDFSIKGIPNGKFKELNKSTNFDTAIDELLTLSHLDDSLYPIYKYNVYRRLLIVKAILISNYDNYLIDEIEYHFNNELQIINNNSKVMSIIDSIFEDSKKIVKTMQKLRGIK